MAAKGGRPLEETPTWAVAVVCFVLIAVSLVIEYTIHLVGKVLVLIMHVHDSIYEEHKEFTNLISCIV